MADAKKSAAKKSASSTEDKGSSDVEVQMEAATGRPAGAVKSGILGGPSQDDLNPAYAPPKDENNPKSESPNEQNPDAPN